MALLTTYTVDNIDAKGYSNWYKMKVEVHVGTPNIAENTTPVTLKQFFATKTASAGFYQNNNAYLKTSLSVDGGSFIERINSKIHEMPQNSAKVVGCGIIL